MRPDWLERIGLKAKLRAPALRLRLFTAGACSHPEWVTLRGGTLRTVKIPAMFACLEHPQHGHILYDTGYAGRFLEATARLPARLYRMVTPVSFRPEQGAAEQLRRCGIDPARIGKIVISHFHADHVAGLRDFPHARFLYEPEAYAAVRRLTGLAALRRAYLPELLPENFAARSDIWSPEAWQSTDPATGFPFSSVLDVLGDGSLLAVKLPGHADGQIGLLFATERHMYFLCADAVWSSRAYRESRPPHPLAGLIMPSRTDYHSSFERIVRFHRLYPEVRIIPSHCSEASGRWSGGGEIL
ncbi:Metallo-beta-lactamase superfamily protein [Paenibacillus sp. UNCCL117]|uniref:MBL fold metallo-hydrolase n=1 Tax=unclassified Paenibacillus TaxID=185978 RepID=UPI000881DCE4|nr:MULTISPECIES: MBL fold metallo-hydrolase [unclassified Paenibacillus]SDD23215.1 Metallo-beta-lactamase superfamily protein [Paenibacillus sp. cl123]SFW41724.1 Metallo-beta-lactamase superfamily protein [Paenibacillus sp. UNCCL117]